MILQISEQTKELREVGFATEKEMQLYLDTAESQSGLRAEIQSCIQPQQGLRGFRLDAGARSVYRAQLYHIPDELDQFS